MVVRREPRRCWWAGVLLCIAFPFATAEASSITPEQINEATVAEKENFRALVAHVQILLDRTRFSPGVIDGRMGENVEGALAAFRGENQLSSKQRDIDEETWNTLRRRAGGIKPMVAYEISKEDVGGPFAEAIPDELEKKKNLERLSYTGPAELLAEKFHMDEHFLKELNPGKDFSKAGTTIMVANVGADDNREQPRAERIVVDKSRKQVRAYSGDDDLLALYPATVGSEERPAPSGMREVKAIARNPTYTYNPDYKFAGVRSKEPFTIPPGPNNPVGLVWIDLADGYGIHGTPEPANIGKTASHGCVRLTNWDAKSLADMDGQAGCEGRVSRRFMT